VAALVAVLLGLVLLYGHGNEVLDSTGVILSLTAGLLYACYILMNRKRTQIASSTLTFYTCLGTAVLFFCLLLSNHTLILPHSSAAWFYILFLGIISTVLPIQLLLNSLQYISSTKVSVLSIFEPVVMVIVGVIFLNEKITFMQGIGILVMLAGAILIQFEKVSEGN
jgi:drug/metabolite transporter (DMT)-like permease